MKKMSLSLLFLFALSAMATPLKLGWHVPGLNCQESDIVRAKYALFFDANKINAIREIIETAISRPLTEEEILHNIDQLGHETELDAYRRNRSRIKPVEIDTLHHLISLLKPQESEGRVILRVDQTDIKKPEFQDKLSCWEKDVVPNFKLEISCVDDSYFQFDIGKCH